VSEAIAVFAACAHQAAQVCKVKVGTLLRVFGLRDLVDNGLLEEDDAPTIAVKALRYFCEDQGPQNDQFKVAVLAVGLFLNQHHAKRGPAAPIQALQDLIPLLTGGANEAQMRKWIASHFG
jgi:hypothetical protein